MHEPALITAVGTQGWIAVGTLVNAATVIILALINWRYLVAAKRQATAAEQQTKAIVLQAELVERQLRLSLQDRFNQRIANIRNTQNALNRLIQELNRLSSSGFDALAPSRDIFPSNWDVIAACIQDELPSLDIQLQVESLHSGLVSLDKEYHAIHQRGSREIDARRREAARNAKMYLDIAEELLRQIVFTRKNLDSP